MCTKYAKPGFTSFVFSIVWKIFFVHLLQASGFGLHSGWTSKRASFSVEPEQPELMEVEQLVCAVRAPPSSETESETPAAGAPHSQKDGTSLPVTVEPLKSPDGKLLKTLTVSYMCLVAGDHAVNVTYLGRHIPGSPFRATIQRSPDASKCQVEAKWFQQQQQAKQDNPVCSLLSGSSFDLTVNATHAGDGQLTASMVHTDTGQAIETYTVLIDDKQFGVHSRVLDLVGQYQVDVKWSGEHIPGSPFTTYVSELLTAAQITVSNCCTGCGCFCLWVWLLSSGQKLRHASFVCPFMSNDPWLASFNHAWPHRKMCLYP